MSSLTNSPLPTDVCPWEYVSEMDVWCHQVWMVLRKWIQNETECKQRQKYFYVPFLTGCRFLFSRWFCSMTFKSCSPRSILSVKEKQVSSYMKFTWGEQHLSIIDITDRYSSCLGWRGWEEPAVRRWALAKKVIVVLESIMKYLQAYAICTRHVKLLIWLIL